MASTGWRAVAKFGHPISSLAIGILLFNKWSRDYTLEKMNESLNRLERQIVHNRESSPSLVLVDSQSVRLDPRIGADRGIDGGKKVNGRKRSILTDTIGRIWRVEVQ